MNLCGKLYLAVVVAGTKHCKARYACLNEDFTLSGSVRRVLVAKGKFVLWDFVINQVPMNYRINADTSLETKIQVTS